MNHREKLKIIKKLLSNSEIMEYLGVEIDTLYSWTRSGKAARNPSPEHEQAIHELYEKLSPCRNMIENLKKK